MEPRQSAIETYRYLRVGIVALALLLLVAVVAQAVSDGALLGSISEYYYTSVGVVLVGVLVALGLGLIVIRGRGPEDVLLNVAGMLAPIIAFVPVPSTIRPEVDADIPVWSLLALGAVGVAFAGQTARRQTGRDRVLALRGVVVAGLVVLGFAAWLAVGHDSLFRGAHYAAAIGMFGVLVVVARINATTASDEARPVVPMLPAARRRLGYRLISWSMLGAVLVGGVLGLLQLGGVVPVPSWLFWIETLLLTLFAAFWVLQTIEYWRNGVPVD